VVNDECFSPSEDYMIAMSVPSEGLNFYITFSHSSLPEFLKPAKTSGGISLT
jgi:hypothetical protein